MTKKPELIITPIDRLWNVGEKEALALRLTSLLKQPELKSHLEQRNLSGAVSRYNAKESLTRANLYDAYDKHKARTFGTFVLTTSNDELKGLATIDPTSRLRRHNFGFPFPTLLSRFVTEIYTPGPKVTAWLQPHSDEKSDKFLSNTYRELADQNGIGEDFYQAYADVASSKANEFELAEPVAYTVEAMASPDWIHPTIRAAGFVEVDRQYYDDRDGRLTVPTMSRYSIAPQA